jgi:hypothetical protein
LRGLQWVRIAAAGQAVGDRLFPQSIQERVVREPFPADHPSRLGEGERQPAKFLGEAAFSGLVGRLDAGAQEGDGFGRREHVDVDR